MATASKPVFKPFVAATESRPELSVRALLLGAIFGILFGAVTVYVGLRAGLTVAASIPISVLSISILRAFGKSSILENNIVQTTGNAGQSIASGVIFTLPALIFLGFDLESTRIFALALFGGWLGVLFMIPLRRQLIVDEHELLPYPEGTACADVLEAGERGGSFASRVFLGLGLGGLYTLFQNENLLGLFPATPNYSPDLGPQHLLKGAAIRADVTPEYLGVGYIIGIRVAAIMLAGSAFSWFVLMPAIVFFGAHLSTPIYPGTIPVAAMTPSDLWKTYVRPMGAGAVAAAGLITLLRTLPTIASALTQGLRNTRRHNARGDQREAGAPSMTAPPSWVGPSSDPSGPPREAGTPSMTAASSWVSSPSDSSGQPREAGAPSMTAAPSWVGSSSDPSGQPREAGAPSMTAASSWVGSSSDPSGQPREAGSPSMTAPSSSVGPSSDPSGPPREAGAPSMTAAPSWVGSSSDPSGQPREAGAPHLASEMWVPPTTTTPRTAHDLPPSVVYGGSFLLVVLLWIFLEFHPVPGAQVGALANLAAALLVVVFGFLFVTVSARIVGIVGSSASPVSGMTIATLMATAAIFVVKGWTAPAFGALAITIGGIVCIAASNAGDTAQDLKTGYLIGATPWKQQLAIMIGVIISTISIGATLNAMNTGLESFVRLPQPIPLSLAALPTGVEDKGPFPRNHLLLTTRNSIATPAANAPRSSSPDSRTELPNTRSLLVLNAIGSSTLEDGKYLYNPATQRIEIQWIQGIGSEKAAAPQGRLMATVINGILSHRLPWSLVLLGVALVLAVELLGIRSLTFAVGAYLSIATTLAIFVGGVMRWMVDRGLAQHAARQRLADQAAALDLWHTDRPAFHRAHPTFDPTNPDHLDPATNLPVPTAVTPALNLESEVSPGALYASGLIAAGGIMGLIGVCLKLYENFFDRTVPRFTGANPLHHDWVSVLAFAALAFSLFFFARKPIDG